MPEPTIVFMGTPEYAVASLNALEQAGYPVAAVFTQPDKPKGAAAACRHRQPSSGRWNGASLCISRAASGMMA